MKDTPSTIDEYLASVPEPYQSALQTLRRQIHEIAPEAVEAITYAVPTVKLNGNLVAFCAAKKHCSFFPMGAAVLDKYRNELEGYSISTGTVRFQPDNPLPDEVLRRIVLDRIAQNKSKSKTRSKPKKSK